MMSNFVFNAYNFDKNSGLASFKYNYNNEYFEERITFKVNSQDYNEQALDRALSLLFVLAGISYYKAFPSKRVDLDIHLDDWQASFFTTVYQEGLGQFAYENKLTRNDLVVFEPNSDTQVQDNKYKGEGILSMQSGGKDSLLLAQMMKNKGIDFTSIFIGSTNSVPSPIGTIGKEVVFVKRQIDIEALNRAKSNGAKNGHIPVTYIVEAISLVQAILLGKGMVLSAVAHEGEEPHSYIGDLPVNHQWSKSWRAEKLMAEYVDRYIAKGFSIGSPLRGYSELMVAELFGKNAWKEFGRSFSSCNQANYKQGNSNSELKWCAKCSKCANSYLLLAPFVEPSELRSIFGGKDLFTETALEDEYKGLLGTDGHKKPFECVGEIDELRTAYHMAQKTGGYAKLPFEVPYGEFDYTHQYGAQEELSKVIQ